jgi:hypothetical protein
MGKEKMKKTMLSLLMVMSAGVFAEPLLETGNLVENPRFLDPDGSYATETTTRPTGWDYAAGNGEVYTPTEMGGGGRFFWGGRSGAYDAIKQSIDLEENINLDLVDAGLLTMNYAATMWSHSTDDSRFRVIQYDGQGNALTGSYVLGYVQNSSPYRYEGSNVVVAGARELLVLIESRRQAGTHNNGYTFDPEVTFALDDTTENRQTLGISENLSLQDAQDVAKQNVNLVVPVHGSLAAILLIGGVGVAAGRKKKK